MSLPSLTPQTVTLTSVSLSPICSHGHKFLPVSPPPSVTQNVTQTAFVTHNMHKRTDFYASHWGNEFDTDVLGLFGKTVANELNICF